MSDVWAAFILNRTTLIPTDSWVDEDSLISVAAKGNTDDYCNLAILIFARIINILNEEDSVGRTSQAELREKAQTSWEELQRWRRWRLRSVKPLLRVDKSERNPFPTVVFALSASSKSSLRCRQLAANRATSMREYLLPRWLNPPATKRIGQT